MEIGAIIGIISMIAGLIGSIFTNQSSSDATERSVERSNAANRELAALQNQWNIEQWNRENAFNSPASQVQRLAAANINPALAMSNGNLVSTGTSSHLESAGTAPMQSVDYMPMAQSMSGAFNQAAMQFAQIDVNRATAENQRAQATKALADVPVSKQHALNAQAQYHEIMSQIDYNRALVASVEEQTYRISVETTDNHLLKLSEIANADATSKLTQKQLESFDETYKATIDNLVSTTKRLDADINYINKQAQQVSEQIKSLELTNQEKANELKAKYGESEAQIRSRIKQMYAEAVKESLAAQQEAQARINQSTWESSDMYMAIQRVRAIQDLFLEPIRAISGAASAGASVSRAASVSKMVK